VPLRNSVIIVILVTFFGVLQSNAQSAKDVLLKYGSPDEQGRYIVRPGIAAKVSISERGQVCNVFIEPTSLATSSVPGRPLMSLKIVDEVIAEFVPESRQDQRRPALSMGGYTTSEEYTYKQATVYLTTVCSSEGEKRVWTVKILLKANGCE